MCQYTRFHFLCGGTKLKILNVCDHAKQNYHGILYCGLDQSAHIDDGKDRSYGPNTYGPGICSHDLCRRIWGVDTDVPEDDTAYDMIPEACGEREDRWFRQCLTAEQQLEFLCDKSPKSFQHMSLHAQFWVYSDYFSQEEWLDYLLRAVLTRPEQMHWRELNPKYMHQKVVWEVSRGAHYLPTSVTDTREDQAQIPSRASLMGPFAIQNHSSCKSYGGFCRICGRWLRKDEAPKMVHGNDHSRYMVAQGRSVEELAASGAYLRQLDTIADRSFPAACEFLKFHCDYYPTSYGVPLPVQDAPVCKTQEMETEAVADFGHEGYAMMLD